jgi:hypothetical protein
MIRKRRDSTSESRDLYEDDTIIRATKKPKATTSSTQTPWHAPGYIDWVAAPRDPFEMTEEQLMAYVWIDLSNLDFQN